MKVFAPTYYSRRWANKRATHLYADFDHIAIPPPLLPTPTATTSPSSQSSSSIETAPSAPPAEEFQAVAQETTTTDLASACPLDTRKPSLPPGTFIGENLALRHREGYQFSLNRVQRYLSHIFSSHLYGEPCIVIAGTDEARLFYDSDHITRADAFPRYLRKAMQGTATVMSMDGPEHLQRKAAIMSCFTDQRLDGFVRLWGRLLDAYVNRWAALEHFSFAPQLIRLHAEFALASVLGAVDVAPRQLAKLSRRMVRAVKSSEGMPLNVPGMGLWRSNKARRGLERCALEQVRRERQTHGGSSSNAGLGDDEKKKAVAEPAEVDVAELAVVRTMAHVKDPETGELLPEEVVASELTNMLIHTMGNAFVGVWLIHAFHENPHVYNSLQAEVEFVHRSHSEPNYYGRKSFLERLDYTECVVREVKRYYPVVPFIPARVKKSFAYSGHLFPKGWLVLLGIPAIHLDGRVYRDPSSFCPARFEAEEHKAVDERYTSVLHGGGDDAKTSHRCPGEQLSTLLLKSLAARLAKDCTWHWTTPQILSYSLLNTPPTPLDGMLVDSFTKTEATGPDIGVDLAQPPMVVVAGADVGAPPSSAVGQNESTAGHKATTDDLNGINNSNSEGGLPTTEVGDTEGPDSAAAMKRRLRRAQTDGGLLAPPGAACPFGYGLAAPSTPLNQ